MDYAYAWAGLYHRSLLDRGLLHFADGLRTAEDRPWIWRLHREADSFAVLGTLGHFYRRGVASSLTQISDERQLDFIRAYNQVLGETAADRDAEALLPKAVRTYCAVIAHHVGAVGKFEPSVAQKLKSLSSAALGDMPQPILDDTLDAMDVQRATLLRRLRHAAGRREGSGCRVTTQIFVASTPQGTATLAAALDAHCFDDADRRILLLCDTSAVPEAAPPADSMPGFGLLRARFDEVLSWNDTISPSTRRSGPRAPTTYPCGNAICATPGTSGTTRSSWRSRRRTPPPPWRSPRSSAADPSRCTWTIW